GSVDFREGTTDLTPGGVALTGGQATFTVSSLSVGSHTISAAYSGNSNFAGSAGDDAAAPQSVVPDGSRTAVTTSPDPSVYGQPVTLTATVAAQSSGAGPPTGTVNFTEGATTLAANVALVNGRA